MLYTIYKTTNVLNEKYYIGMHKTKNPNDAYLGSGRLLVRAIKKYGKQYFSKETLFCFDNEQEMKNKESEVVVPNSVDPKSYNLCPGGHGGFGYINANNMNHNGNQLEITKKINSARSREYFVNMRKQRKTPGKDTMSSSFSFKGRFHKLESLHKMKETFKTINHNKKEKNSQYGTCWITNGINNKKIKKEELDFYITQGYTKGRRIKL